MKLSYVYNIKYRVRNIRYGAVGMVDGLRLSHTVQADTPALSLYGLYVTCERDDNAWWWTFNAAPSMRYKLYHERMLDGVEEMTDEWKKICNEDFLHRLVFNEPPYNLMKYNGVISPYWEYIRLTVYLVFSIPWVVETTMSKETFQDLNSRFSAISNRYIDKITFRGEA